MATLTTILETRRDLAVATYDNIRQQLVDLDHEPDFVDNPQGERILLDAALAKVITRAERINHIINTEDVDVRTICFVCSKCGAYANDRRADGTCDCDDGCGTVEFDMLVL